MEILAHKLANRCSIDRNVEYYLPVSCFLVCGLLRLTSLTD